MTLLLKLFWAFIQIGLFSIGGGYAALPLIQEQIVEKNGWLSMSEFVDLVTIAEMTPGPIAINSATFVGTSIAGVPGAAVATFGVIVPSLIIVFTLAYVYYRFQDLKQMQGILGALRPVVVALIASAGLSILKLAFWNGGAVSLEKTNVTSVIIAISAFFVLRKFKTSPIIVMIATGLIGILLYLL
jgi:chromate transporter